MDIASQSNQFEHLLKQTILWCETRIDTDSPRTCLRSLELRPDLESLQYKDDDIWIYPQLVDEVIHKRQLQFASSAISSRPERGHQSTGRLLLVAQDYSNHNNLTSHLTGGFFDYNDVPPWDTWVILIEGILVCWIPGEFRAMVHEAMQYEAMGILAWTDDLPEPDRTAIDFHAVVPKWFQEFMNRPKGM
jgi:hypothetical protein